MAVLQEAEEGIMALEVIWVCIQMEETQSAAIFRRRFDIQDCVCVRSHCVSDNAQFLLPLLRMQVLSFFLVRFSETLC